jgi:predicted glycogen debranching enzyme
VKLQLRPFLSGRDYHATHHENPDFGFEAADCNGWLSWRPYDGVPQILALTNGQYHRDAEWFRNFLYEFEKERGLDFLEDLASPGTLTFDLTQPAVLIFAAEGHDSAINKLAAPLYPDYSANKSTTANDPAATWERLAQSELARRQRFPTPLYRAADAYLVGRGDGQTIIAGYPWFTDWGRDTFISLRGLCLAIDRFDEAKQILLAWSQTVSEGMLPNRFPDAGSEPEFNSVDASLWFIVAVHDLIDAAARQNRMLSADHRGQMEQAVLAIVEGYSRGTRFGIRMDSDGLLAAGQPSTQLTWMDAKVGDHTITPRVGKPVEVQALWLNALWIAGRIDRRWNAVFERGRSEFERRFWNASIDSLFDVVDVDHAAGVVDVSLRPNQIFAIGGLPLAVIHGPRARNIVDAVERHLLTPLGLRTLASGSPGYAPQCVGLPEQRDAAYHQGTVWPWLMGPFVEAWARVRGGTAAAKQQARQRFLPPLEKHLESSGLGHISEVTDAEPPFTPRGCPFQAWSLGEFLRLKYSALRVDD